MMNTKATKLWLENLIGEVEMTTDEHIEFVENAALKCLKSAQRKHRRSGLTAADHKTLKSFISAAEDLIEGLGDILADSSPKASDRERRKAQSEFLRLQARQAKLSSAR